MGSSRRTDPRAAHGWHQWLLVIAGVAILSAMVIVAELSRETSDRHRRAEVLVESVRASSEQLSATTERAIADSLMLPARQRRLDPTVVSAGISIWDGLTSQLAALAPLDSGPLTARLQRDAAAVYTIGYQIVDAANTRGVSQALTVEQQRFRPAVDRLNADAQVASRHERAVADRASRHAMILFLVSLLAGLAGLTLLGWRLARLRREATLAAQRHAIELRSEARMRALFDRLSEVVTVLDRDLRVQWQSQSIKRALGYDAASLRDRPLTEIVHPEDRELLGGFLRAVVDRSGAHTLSARFDHADAGWRHMEVIAENRLGDPVVQGIVLSMRDFSVRKALEDELRHQAFHDALTGLANRALFEDRLTLALAGARRQEHSFAVLFLDLDEFKAINDAFGHSRGDELLRDVAMRIGEIIRPTDTAARLGGDEFAVLVEALENDGDAYEVAQRILAALAWSFVLDGHELRVTASVGMAICDGSETIEDVLRRADMAMYSAKREGKAAMRTFDPARHLREGKPLELS